ncbi:hypothetical protein AB0A73_03475 [Glycomyces sp. NPDC047369]
MDVHTLTPAPPAERRRPPTAPAWFRVLWCLALWPVVFAGTFTGTFAAVAVYHDDPAGPLFWPLGWAFAAVVFLIAVGVPMLVFTWLRAWYLRLIPAAIIAVPAWWLLTQAGLWALPAVSVAAGAIMAEAFGWRHLFTVPE